ncbi:MAG TPA: hypothetical protein PKW69_00390 [Niabella sp.]|nr:hypothetical protein [Niabella sp.]
MKNNQQFISVETARLIIGFLHNHLSSSDKDALDDWICLSDKNMKIFEQLTEHVDENVFDPDQLIVDTEGVIDLWIVASLIIRHQKGLNNELEELYLNEWINAGKQNQKFFKQLEKPACMQKMLVWNKLKRTEILTTESNKT